MTTETDTVKTEDPSQAPASENRPVHEVEMAQILCGMQTKRTSGGGKKGTESNDKDSETSSSSDDNANANAKAENSIKTEDVRKEDNQASTTTSKGKSTAGKEGKVKVKVNVKSRGNPTSASSDYPVVGPHFRFNAANAGALLPNPEGGNKDLPKLKNTSGASSAQIHPHQQPMPPLNWGANANANANATNTTSTGTGANAGNHAYFNPNNNNQAATNLNGKTPNGKNTGPDIKPLMAAGSARVTDLDVLLGRGGMTNKHPGNVRFRTLVDSLKPRYIALGSSKKKKKQFSEHLMHTVMEYGGRFLVCHQGKIGVWTEADLATSRKKCSQALREGKTVSAPVKFPDIKLPPNFAAPMPPLLDGTGNGNVAKIAVASAMANTSIPVVGQAQAQVTSAVSAPGTTATALVTIAPAPAPAKNPPPPPAAVGPGIESKVSMKDVSSIQQDVPIQPNVSIQQVQPGASGGESSANDTADQISKKRKVEMEEEPSKPAKVPKIEIQKSSNQAQAQAPPKKFGEAFVESAVGGDVKDGVPEVGLENEHSGEGANENIPLSSAKFPSNAIETVPVSINEEMPAKISTPALSHETTKEKSPSNLNEIPKTLETSLPGKNLVEPTKTPDVVMTLPADSPRPAKKSDEITNANTVTSVEEADRARKESHQFFRINEVPILPKVAQTENSLNDSQKTVVSTFQGQDIKDSESVPPTSNGIDSSTNPNSNVDAIAQPLSGCQDKMNVCIIPAIPPVTNMNGVDDNGVGPAKTQLQEPSVPGTTGDLNHGDDLNTCLPMPPLATGVIPDKNMPLNNGHMGRVSPIAPSNNGQTTHVPGSDGVPTTHVSIIVANPTQNDVLLGRGGFTNKHDGNIRFRDIVAREKERYNNLGNSKKEKKRFSERIADAVHSYGGRFLVKEKNDWVVAHPSVARKKCSQALRE